MYTIKLFSSSKPKVIKVNARYNGWTVKLFYMLLKIAAIRICNLFLWLQVSRQITDVWWGQSSVFEKGVIYLLQDFKTVSFQKHYDKYATNCPIYLSRWTIAEHCGRCEVKEFFGVRLILYDVQKKIIYIVIYYNLKMQKSRWWY